jgi:multicomponent Na+:H+ antiporter subunit C
METVLAILTGAMVAGSVFLMLSKNLVRFIFGLVLASNAVNLLIFAAGRLKTSRPPLIPQDATHACRGGACQQPASGVDS